CHCTCLKPLGRVSSHCVCMRLALGEMSMPAGVHQQASSEWNLEFTQPFLQDDGVVLSRDENPRHDICCNAQDGKQEGKQQGNTHQGDVPAELVSVASGYAAGQTAWTATKGHGTK